MASVTKARIIRILLVTYMVAVCLFAYVVLTTPADSQAQCKTITFCAHTSASTCCPGGQGTGYVWTGARYGGPNYYSEICVQP